MFGGKWTTNRLRTRRCCNRPAWSGGRLRLFWYTLQVPAPFPLASTAVHASASSAGGMASENTLARPAPT